MGKAEVINVPIYLDYLSTTPVDPRVVEAMTQCLSMDGVFGNPASRSHQYGWKAEEAIENARCQVAELINADPREIVWTSGATESDNLAIKGAAHFYQRKGKHIITSKIEHKAVLDTCRQLEREGFEVTYLEPNTDGLTTPEMIADAIREDTSVVSVMHANNEIGTLLPIKKVSQMCRQNDALFHSDTVQTICHYAFDLEDLDIDFITCAAHKFHGPKGVGFLYANKNLNVESLIHGGSQERGHRGGTENVYGIVGLAKAMELAYHDMEGHQSHVQGLKTHMINELKEHFSDISFHGEIAPEKSLYTLLNVCFPATSKGSMLLFTLDLKGIACSGGSACNSGATMGSHVLTGIQADMNRPNVRFSFSRYTTQEDVDYVLEVVKDVFETTLAE